MTRFITLVSGKGGVGKTTTAINLGQALTDMGKKVVVVDANLVTPNIGIHLGVMNPEGTINKFLRKEKDLKDAMYLHESGLTFIPASPSYSEFQKTNPQKMTEIFEHLDNTADFVLIDAPSGLGYDVSHILKNSDEALIVTTPNLSAVMDALKTVQVAQAHDNTIAGIVLNMTHWASRHELKLEEVERILNYPVIATLRVDGKIRKAIHRQVPLNYLHPHSKSARQFTKIAEHISHHKEIE